jgi:hypothetical protein
MDALQARPNIRKLRKVVDGEIIIQGNFPNPFVASHGLINFPRFPLRNGEN